MMSDEFVSGHYCGSDGELLSTEGKLISLGDLIRLVSYYEELPVRPAAKRVLDDLMASPSICLYVTQPGDWARRIDADHKWQESRHADNRQPPPPNGTPGLIHSLATYWGRQLVSSDELYPPIFRNGRAALLFEDAASMFPNIFDESLHQKRDEQSRPEKSDHRAQPQPKKCTDEGEKIVLPEGGTWPHVGGEWTDAERAAMFRMRHKHKMAGVKIAKVVGVTRQRIDEQIGPARLVGNWQTKLSWVPSTDLLKECGIALQPLQAIAASTA